MGNELSSREKIVLGWLLKGFSNKEIGQALGISPRTVQKHLQRVYRNLDVSTRAEAIVLAHKRKNGTGRTGSKEHLGEGFTVRQLAHGNHRIGVVKTTASAKRRI